MTRRLSEERVRALAVWSPARSTLAEERAMATELIELRALRDAVLAWHGPPDPTDPQWLVAEREVERLRGELKRIVNARPRTLAPEPSDLEFARQVFAEPEVAARLEELTALTPPAAPSWLTKPCGVCAPCIEGHQDSDCLRPRKRAEGDDK